ncbi:MAG: ATP12 family protein [Alphaproteobacteria bacterium]|jgi:chaperone required for assembly of F1-ATPase
MTRSLFEDWYPAGIDPASYDPVATARLAMKPQLPKRFYEKASFDQSETGFRLLLDGRPAKTPARATLAVPSAELGTALAAEWNAQTTHINPAEMPLTRLANAILDGVVDKAEAVADEIVRYAGSDLLCYRADTPQSLVARQAAAWDPVLAWARTKTGATFILTEGVVFVAQPDDLLGKIRPHVPQDPWRLGATSVVTTLTGSAVLGLALAHRAFDREAVWQAAHVDEDFQTDMWGFDVEAAERRAARRRDYDAAALVLSST